MTSGLVDEPTDAELVAGCRRGDAAKPDEAMSVRAGLAQLGEECQEVLDRFFCRDESYRTIGEELDIPAGTIASRISRCLGHLRSELEAEGRKLRSPPSSGQAIR